MKPSFFANKYPWDSIMQNSESETVAMNIMIILKRTGDEFRPLSFDEYKQERIKDGNFSDKEKPFFDNVIRYCNDAESAKIFSNSWA